jgi:hypothetical protein
VQPYKKIKLEKVEKKEEQNGKIEEEYEEVAQDVGLEVKEADSFFDRVSNDVNIHKHLLSFLGFPSFVALSQVTKKDYFFAKANYILEPFSPISSESFFSWFQLDRSKDERIKEKVIKNYTNAYRKLVGFILSRSKTDNFLKDSIVIRVGTHGEKTPIKYNFLILASVSINGEIKGYRPYILVSYHGADVQELNAKVLSVQDKSDRPYFSTYDVKAFWTRERSYKEETKSLISLMGGTNFVSAADGKILYIKREGFDRLFALETTHEGAAVFLRGAPINNVVFFIKDILDKHLELIKPTQIVNMDTVVRNPVVPMEDSGSELKSTESMEDSEQTSQMAEFDESLDYFINYLGLNKL